MKFTGDYASCLEFCRKTLTVEPGFSRAIVLADKIFEEAPFLKKMYRDAYTTFEDALQNCDISAEVGKEVPLENT